jgi:hypothetical protein
MPYHKLCSLAPISIILLACSDPGSVVVPEPDRPTIASIAIVVDTVEIQVGDVLVARVRLQDPTGSPILPDGIAVEWTSAKPLIAAVDGGTITGRSRGRTRIRASAGAASDEVEIAVYPTPPGNPYELWGSWGNSSHGTIFSLTWKHDGSQADRTRVEYTRLEADSPWRDAEGYTEPGGMATSWTAGPKMTRDPLRFRARRCTGDPPLETCSGYSNVVTIGRDHTTSGPSSLSVSG